jgi:hypothetical protein
MNDETVNIETNETEAIWNFPEGALTDSTPGNIEWSVWG